MQTKDADLSNAFYKVYEALPKSVQQLFIDSLKENSFSNFENDLQKTISEDQQKRAIEIFDSYRDELRKRQLSNTENYDKTILSLSSSGLALSLTAIKFAIPLEKATYICLLHWSWWLFGVTILISIIAYWISDSALNKQLEFSEEYYIEGKEDAFKKRNWWSTINNWLNITAGITFLIATALVILFVTLNI